jgi:deazaflavin-dependent oxidoreductase (nitroreductase family)
VKPIPKCDPTEPKGPLDRATGALVKTEVGSWLVKNGVSRVEPALLRISGGRLKFGGGPRVNLTVIGRKSGEPRTAALGYFTRGDEVILMASNFGGKNLPAWYLNLAAAEECQLQWRGGEGRYLAREAEDPERSELYALANELFSVYGKYQTKTEGVRKIPVMVLTPAS